MKRFFYIVLLGVGLTACKVDNSVNPDLLGTWANVNQIYTFRDDLSYSLENRRTGDEENPVVVDSVWGNYELDNTRSNVTFHPEGYRDTSGTLFDQALNDQTWEYTISGNKLTYESNTTIGELERVE